MSGGGHISNLYIASQYKNTITHLLLQNKDFIKFVKPEDIFDYDFADDSTAEEKTFVFIETEIPAVRQNIFTDFNLYVYVFAAKSLVPITDNTIPSADEVNEMGYCGNRIDLLCDIIDRTLNGSESIQGIGDVKPSPENYVTNYRPNSNYYGKCLKYTISNYNKGGDSVEY